MSKKTQKSYEHVLRFIDANVFRLKPASFTTDFEKALRSGILKVYPEVQLKGCWFHYCQALRRKLTNISELAKFVKTTDAARRIFKKMLVLPLLPPDDIPTAFNLCKQEAYASMNCYYKSENVFEKFFDYFQRQWIDLVSTYIYIQKILNMYIYFHRKVHSNFLSMVNAYELRALWNHITAFCVHKFQCMAHSGTFYK